MVENALCAEPFRSMRSRLLDTMIDVASTRGGKIKVGTMCSGRGTQEMVPEIFNELWKEYFPCVCVQVPTQQIAFFI